MELKDFIKETLAQIIEGVKSAQEAVKESGEINPNQAVYGKDIHERTVRDVNGQIIHMVDFDVSVSSAEGSELKGGGGIVIGPVKIGANGSISEKGTSENRVKFQVPISYPKFNKQV